MSLPPPPPPGPPPPPPPTPYGYLPFGGAGAKEHPKGTTVLVFGILSLACCGLLGPIAWGMGNKAKREMDAEPGTMWTNRGSVTAGRVCGIIGTCLLALQIGFLVIAILASAATGP